MRKCDGFWSETERFHFFFIFEFFSFFLSQSSFSVCLVSSLLPLSSNFLGYVFFRENDRKSDRTEKRMMREEDEERGGALDPLLLSEEVDSEEEDKEEKGEIDDCEA